MTSRASVSYVEGQFVKKVTDSHDGKYVQDF